MPGRTVKPITFSELSISCPRNAAITVHLKHQGGGDYTALCPGCDSCVSPIRLSFKVASVIEEVNIDNFTKVIREGERRKLLAESRVKGQTIR